MRSERHSHIRVVAVYMNANADSSVYRTPVFFAALYSARVLCRVRRRAQTYALSLKTTKGVQRKPGVQVRLAAGSPKASRHSHLNPGFKVVWHASTWRRMHHLLASPTSVRRTCERSPYAGAGFFTRRDAWQSSNGMTAERRRVPDDVCNVDGHAHRGSCGVRVPVALISSPPRVSREH